MAKIPPWFIPLLAGVMLISMVAGCTSQQPASPSPTPSPVAYVSGADLFFGRAPLAGGVPCMTCHTLDTSGRAGVGPNLAGVGRRAGERMPGVNAREYLERSIRAHDEFIVPGHQGGMVRAVVGDDYGNLLPDEQIAALVDFLLQQQAVAVASVVVTSVPATPTSLPAPTATATATPTIASTATATPTLSPMTAVTPTVSPLPNATATPSPQVTATASATITPAFTSTPTSIPPTATPLPLPTDTPLPAPTPTPPPPTPTTVPEPTPVPPVASEAGLEQYLGCVNCHNLHPQQVRMPHPLNPTCNDCHRGSPSRVGCPTCHSMHQIDNRHEPVPDLPCHVCHQ